MTSSARLSRAEFPRKPASRRLGDELFSIGVWPLQAGTEPRFSCVVSKKVAKKAVERNLLKRRCREIVAPILRNSTKPIAVVVYPKKTALTASFGEMRVALASLLAKVIA